MVYKVLIAGAGQLGSRYLQGLAKCTVPLSIYVCDVSASSLAVAQSRWIEAGGDTTQHSLQLFINYDELPAEIDLAIISTNALVRLEVVKQVVEKTQVKNWLLEKVLAQSEEKIKRMGAVIGTQSKAWVNTPYRAMDWYNRIKTQMILPENFSCEITGGKTFGLACNSIHYLDLLVWLSGQTITAIRTGRLDKEWFKSKRVGFWDIFGNIEVDFSGGSVAVIRGETFEPSKTTVRIKSASEEWVIHENDGIAIRNNDLTINGRDEYQSEITAPVVESILLSGNCALPTLAESTAIHLPMIRSLLDHWNQYMPEKLEEVPIT